MSPKYYFKWHQLVNGQYVPSPIWESFGIERIEGSGLVLPARILGLDWISYLKFCRQNGATLIGKNQKYVRPCWVKSNSSFMDYLNNRAAALDKIIDLKGLSY